MQALAVEYKVTDGATGNENVTINGDDIDVFPTPDDSDGNV